MDEHFDEAVAASTLAITVASANPSAQPDSNSDENEVALDKDDYEEDDCEPFNEAVAASTLAADLADAIPSAQPDSSSEEIGSDVTMFKDDCDNDDDSSDDGDKEAIMLSIRAIVADIKARKDREQAHRLAGEVLQLVSPMDQNTTPSTPRCQLTEWARRQQGTENALQVQKNPHRPQTSECTHSAN
jgi:hypothetical protein